MIKLNIEDYCQDCPLFEAHTNKLYDDNHSLITWIYCEHKNVCKCIPNHLLKKLKEQEKWQRRKLRG